MLFYLVLLSPLSSVLSFIFSFFRCYSDTLLCTEMFRPDTETHPHVQEMCVPFSLLLLSLSLSLCLDLRWTRVTSLPLHSSFWGKACVCVAAKRSEKRILLLSLPDVRYALSFALSLPQFEALLWIKPNIAPDNRCLSSLSAPLCSHISAN